MKKLLLITAFSMITGCCIAQEWFTSFDVAKHLALVQNKMLFVLWEESFSGSIPLMVKSDSGTTIVIDLAKDTSWDTVIKEYFVPVRLQEANYEAFIKAADGRSYNYVNKLLDNSIKIMDINGNILNVDMSTEVLTNFTELIDKYALNTAFINMELRNYDKDKSYLTSYLLGEKYIEYAIYATKETRSDIIDLANIYLSESETLAAKSDLATVRAVKQKIELIRIEESLILERTGKARRQLNRIEADEIDPINERLYGFLQYTIHQLRNDETNAELWKSKISSLDLRKAEMILNILKHGNYN
ncbi:MAG: hypothetical protein R2797_05395 [Gelidibacter sp.]